MIEVVTCTIISIINIISKSILVRISGITTEDIMKKYITCEQIVGKTIKITQKKAKQKDKKECKAYIQRSQS